MATVVGKDVIFIIIKVIVIVSFTIIIIAMITLTVSATAAVTAGSDVVAGVVDNMFVYSLLLTQQCY